MSIWFAAILTGFSIGVIGNIHCIAMCGPLALSLPIHQYNNAKKIIAITYYNFGRAISYTMLGIVFGLIGNSFSLFGLQQALSIVAGIVLLLLTFSNFFASKKIFFIEKFKSLVQQKLATALQQNNSTFSYLFVGFLNGLLPCGLVYIAITTALAMGNVYYSMLVMFAFGIGTFPLMISLLLLGNNISFALRNKFKKVAPVLVSVLACLLILRGLNLGIPYVSPQSNITTKKINSCH